MQVWQLQEAKAKLSQLMNDARSAPQIISRHGIHETIILSMDAYEKLVGKKKNIIACLRNSPLVGFELDLTRDSSSMRDMEL
jgi:prevent-host-death family protein